MVTLKKQAVGILLTASCIVSLGACSAQTSSSESSTPSSSQTSAATSSSTDSASQSKLFGKVTAVNGSKITLALGTLGGNRQSGGNPGNGPQSAASGSENKKGNPPSGSRPDKNGGQPEGQKGGNASGSTSAPQNQGADMLALTGETTTITISDTSVIQKQSMRGSGGKNGQSGSTSGSPSGTSSASLSDIKVGTVLSIEKDSNGTLTSVIILGDSKNESAAAKK